jgi:transcription termination factor Rho
MVKRFVRNGCARATPSPVTGAVKACATVRDSRRQATTGRSTTRLVSLDTVNGMTPRRPSAAEFGKLTPLYPQERLRLETEPGILTTRIIDLVAPIGKGQRGLIVAPPKAGKTMVMQAIANAITTNNPECHLMVVLVDERPEEVTDMQRTVKGEVIASTFDRPADDHTTVAELAIERAKRLVEMGTTWSSCSTRSPELGRAYNLAAPASGASSPVASTPPRSTRRRSSSARPATSRTAAR